jgi:hypothetical protein
MRFSTAFVLFSLFSVSASAQKLVSGYIVTNNDDTLSCKFLKSTEGKNDYHFVEVLLDSGIMKRLYPSQLKAVLKSGNIYKSIHVKSSDSIRHFLLRQITVGKTELYYYDGGVIDEGATYYFKKRGDLLFRTFSTQRKVKSFDLQNDARGRTFSNVLYFGNDELFNEFFFIYLKDCPLVSRKIKIGFYTRDDAEAMFKEYNECK